MSYIVGLQCNMHKRIVPYIINNGIYIMNNEYEIILDFYTVLHLFVVLVLNFNEVQKIQFWFDSFM